jgi:hypothetical protein
VIEAKGVSHMKQPDNHNVLQVMAEDLVALRYPCPAYNPLTNPDHIRDILGVCLPLNESFPYSTGLANHILQEQLIYENMLKKLGDYVKDKTAPLRDLAYVVAITIKDPSKANMWRKSLQRRIVNGLTSKIRSVLKGLGLDKVWLWIHNNIITPAGKMTGFRNVLNMAGLAVLLHAGWKYVGKLIPGIDAIAEKGAGAIGDAIKEKLGTAFEEIKNDLAAWFKDKLGSLWDTIKGTVTDFDKWLDVIGPIFGGFSFVAKMLAPSTAAMTKFIKTGEKSAYASVVGEQLIRQYVRRILLAEASAVAHIT